MRRTKLACEHDPRKGGGASKISEAGRWCTGEGRAAKGAHRWAGAGWLAARPAPKVMQTAHAGPGSSSQSDNTGDAPGTPTRSGPLTSMQASTKTPLTNDRKLWTPNA